MSKISPHWLVQQYMYLRHLGQHILLKYGATALFYCPQRSCGKVMFSQASVILFTGRRGVSVADTPGQTPPWADTTQADTPPGRHLQEDTPPWEDTPLGRHSPPGKHPPGQTPPGPVHAGIHTSPAQCMLGYTPPAQCLLGYDGHCSGRYASYWNAFLFTIVF